MLRVLMWVLLCCATPAFAEKPAPVAAESQATLVGEYHLDGVMETGSGLRLNADGTFDWFFTYGALDLGARGKWERAGNGVDLVVDAMGYPPQMPDTQFERMHLRLDGQDLVPTWPWDIDDFRKGAERGTYSRSE
jgi:hypothetical protein